MRKLAPDVGDHEGLAVVVLQGVLEEASELALAVRRDDFALQFSIR